MGSLARNSGDQRLFSLLCSASALAIYRNPRAVQSINTSMNIRR
jgi:hypothetical protein